MEIKENVYEQNDQTKETEMNETGAGEKMPPDSTLAVLGKFKSVDALAQAYSALQAEFTRRSQRLKKLEREAENLKANSDDAEHSGVEKLRRNAKAKRAENKRFDEFVADVVAENVAVKPVNALEKDLECDIETATLEEQTEGVKQCAQMGDEPKDKQLADGTAKADNAENADNAGNALPAEAIGLMQERAEIADTAENGEERNTETANVIKDVGITNGEAEGKSVAKNDDAVFSSEHLYQKVLEDEKVRLRIIGEYLASIGKSGAPVTCGNAGILSAPPLRAKSIADAGGMALHYFKRKTDGEK